MLQRFAHGVLKYRVWILVVCLSITGFFFYHMLQIKMFTEVNDLYPQGHEYVKLYNEIRDSFGGANSFVIEVAVKEGDIFNEVTLGKIMRITSQLEFIEGADRYKTVSIAAKKIKDIKSTAWGLLSPPLMWPEIPKTPEEIEHLKSAIYSNDMYYGDIVSLDSKKALIMGELYDVGVDYDLTFRQITEICDKERDENTEIFLSGEPIVRGWCYHFVSKIGIILIVTSLLILGILYLYIRSMYAMLVPISSIVIGIIWGLGFAHLMGFNFDPLILVVPFLICARAASHSVQMVERYYDEYEIIGQVKPAVEAAFVGIWTPGVLSMVTDAFGVMAISIAPIPLMTKLATIGTVWVVSLIVGGLLFDPIILSYARPPKKRRDVKPKGGILDKIFSGIGKWPTAGGKWVILVIAATLLVWSVMNVRRLTVGDVHPGTPILWPDSRFNLDTKRINEDFLGTDTYYIVVEGDAPGAIHSPEVLRTMNKFQRYLEEDPMLGGTTSLADMLMKINLKMNEDDPKWEIIPDSRMDIGVLQYLFISGGDPGDLDEYITTDNRISNIAAYVKEHRGSTVRNIIRRSKEFIEKHPMVMEGSDLVTTAGSATVTLESTDIEHMGITEGFELFIDSGPDAGGYKILSIDSKNQLTLANNLTNTGRGFSYRVPIARFRLAGGLIGILAAANEVIAESQVRNLTIIFSVIFILCAITYRSFFAGFLFIISIGLANLLAFAFMGARGIGLNVNTLPVSSLGIGLGVDYGIYVISRIRDEYRISKDVKKSIIASISTAGKAVVYTATTLSAGVAIWGFSPLRFQAEMGLLLAFLMMANMLGGIFLLPAIVSIFKPRFVFPGES